MFNWSAIDTVLLDMDGTLLDLRFDNFFWMEYLPRRYAEHHGKTLAAAAEYLTAFSVSLQGSLNWYCLDHWSEAIGMDVEAIKREVRDQVRYRPGSEDFLRFLHDSGKRCILVTNAHPKALELKLVASGLGKYLHAMYSTHPFQVAKENPGFWPKLASAATLDYKRCLFIDDSLNVLRRAHAEGLPHLLHVLQPDTTLPARAPAEFPGIIHFREIMH
jgi:HAD superfamily hydrolase (TIGR01509 family)